MVHELLHKAARRSFSRSARRKSPTRPPAGGNPRHFDCCSCRFARRRGDTSYFLQGMDSDYRLQIKATSRRVKAAMSRRGAMSFAFCWEEENAVSGMPMATAALLLPEMSVGESPEGAPALPTLVACSASPLLDTKMSK